VGALVALPLSRRLAAHVLLARRLFAGLILATAVFVGLRAFGV
jgi:hypothetical protein